jgi:hypothetical protein
MEDFYIGAASVKLFLPIFQMNFPEIVDMALPAKAPSGTGGGQHPKDLPDAGLQDHARALGHGLR